MYVFCVNKICKINVLYSLIYSTTGILSLFSVIGKYRIDHLIPSLRMSRVFPSILQKHLSRLLLNENRT